MDHLLAGLVVREQSGFFWVETEQGSIYRCRLRGRLLEQAQSTDVAAIGDRVMISLVENDMENNGSIESVLPRTSVISRAVRTEGSRGAGSSEREQVIVANADQAFFVFAAANPSPSPRMLDRFLVIGEKAGIDDLFIVVNKMDLAAETEDPALIRKRFQIYEQLDYRVLYTSAVTGEGVDELSALLRDRISVFTGRLASARPACSTGFSRGWGGVCGPSASIIRKGCIPHGTASWSGLPAAVIWRIRRGCARSRSGMSSRKNWTVISSRSRAVCRNAASMIAVIVRNPAALFAPRLKRGISRRHVTRVTWHCARN